MYPLNQNDLCRTKLGERRQRATEMSPELGQSERRLFNLEYSTALGYVIYTLTKEQFIDASVDSNMRLKVKQARPMILNYAIRHAVELELLELKSHLHPLQTNKLDC